MAISVPHPVEYVHRRIHVSGTYIRNTQFSILHFTVMESVDRTQHADASNVFSLTFFHVPRAVVFLCTLLKTL